MSVESMAWRRPALREARARHWIVPLALLLLCAPIAGCEKRDTAPPSPPPAAPAAPQPREPDPVTRRGPAILVAVAAPGFPAPETDDQLALPLMMAAQTLPGAASVTTLALPDAALLRVELERGRDHFEARRQLLDRISTVSSRLPDSAEPPTFLPAVAKLEPTVRLVAQSEQMSGAELRRAFDDGVRLALFRIPGVAAVTVCGGRLEQITVALDPERARAYGIGMEDVASALRAALLDTGRLVGAKSAGIDDIEAARLGRGEVRVSDVASITTEGKPPKCMAFLDGREVISAGVHVAAGADEDDVRQAILERIRDLDLGGLTLREIPRPDERAVAARVDAPGTAEDRGRLSLRLDETVRRELGAGTSALVEAGWPTGLLPAGPPGRYEVVALRTGEGGGAQLVASLRRLPGIIVRGASPHGAAGELRTLRVFGEDGAALHAVTNRARDLAVAVPGVSSATILDAEGSPEVRVRPDREHAARLGLGVRAIREAISMSATGVEVGVIRSHDALVPVRLSAGGPSLEDAARLGNLTIATADGMVVRLTDVATLERVLAPAPVRRADGRRYRVVEVMTGDAEAARAVRRELESSLELPQGVTVEWSDEPELLR